MEGSALARKSELDLAVFTAWHTAVFALTGYGGKLKRLPDYLSRDEADNKVALKHAQGIAFFHRLQARGVPVKITRETIN